jgi:hypothetical protein
VLKMHNALGQAQIELATVDFALAVGHHLHRTVMQEHQVKVGTVAQLPAPSFP